jgi:hypothetical protein
MPKYDILARCNACGDEHSIDLISLTSGPSRKQSIAEAFGGKDLPPELAALKNNRVYCPKTGKGYAQADYDKIFLVPRA